MSLAPILVWFTQTPSAINTLAVLESCGKQAIKNFSGTTCYNIRVSGAGLGETRAWHVDGISTMTAKINKSNEEWKKQLDPQQYNVTREKGTERAFTGKYWDCKDKGSYLCVCCGAELFHSDSKYDSGSGWPSYYQPVAKDAVETEEDHSLFMKRVEVHCSRCDAHLGHVFEDGPRPTGLRYCINSASLQFKADGSEPDS